MRKSGTAWLMAGTTLAAFGAACGDDQGPGEPPLVIEKPATSSGDGQTGPVGVALGSPLRVLITRDGEPVQGVDIEWGAGEGGSLTGEEESDETGIASAVWILGPQAGSHSASATLDGAEGSPLTYTATGTEAAGTIQVLGPEGGNRFEPATLNVTAGQTVTWVWPGGAMGHNVNPDDGDIPDRSGNLADGPTTYSYTFNEIGTFRYYCEAHGALGGFGMSGQVVVTAAGS
jgi:plastocyanin